MRQSIYCYRRYCVMVVAVFVFFIPANAHQDSKDRIELTRLEKVWNDAYLHGDADTLNQLLGDDLVVTMTAMRVLDKADSIAIIRSGRVKFQRYETSELRIQVYGDAAVVSGLLERTRDAGGQITEDKYRFTKVYIRKANKWTVVAWHASIP